MPPKVENVSDRVKLLLHPVRIRVLHALSRRNMTTAELGEVLKDVPQATLYRNLRRLLEKGVLEVASERRVRGIIEKTYALVPEKVGLDGADIRRLGREDLRGYFATFLALLQTDFEDYLGLERLEPEKDSLHFYEVPMRVTDEEAGEVEGIVRETLDRFAERGADREAGRRWRVMGFVSVPLEDRQDRGT